MFTDLPPNSHYERLKQTPLSYSYSVPVGKGYTQLTFRAPRHASSGDRILTPDISRRQRPLPPVPQESGCVLPDSRWVKTHGKMCSGRSQWYYRVENAATVESSGSDSDPFEDEKKKISSTSSNVIFRTPPSLLGSPPTSTAKNSIREPCPPSSMTSQLGEVTATPVPPPRSSKLKPTANSCGDQKPSNSSVRRQGYAGSGMRQLCGSYKRSSNHAVATFDICQAKHPETEEDHTRLVRYLVLPRVAA